MDMTMKVDFEKRDDRSIWEKLFDDAMDHAEVNTITPSMIKRRGMIARYIVDHYAEMSSDKDSEHPLSDLREECEKATAADFQDFWDDAHTDN